MSDQDKQPEVNRIFAILKQHLFSMGVFTALLNLLMLAPALYMLQVYDRVITSYNTMTLLMLTLILLGVYAFMAGLDWVRSRLLIRQSNQIDQAMGSRVLQAAFSQSLKTSQGSIQPINDLTTLRQFLTGQPLLALLDAPWFPIYLLVIFLFHPWLGMLALGGTLLLAVLAWLNNYTTRRYLAQANQQGAEASQYAGGLLRNAEVSQALGMIGPLTGHWQQRHTRYLVNQNLASEKNAAVTSVSKYLRLALQSLMLGLGGLLVIQGQLTPGMMIAGSILVGRALAPIDQLIAAFNQWSSVRLSWQRLSSLLQDNPELPPRISLPPPSGSLQVRGLTLILNRKPVLQNLNFSLNPGETLGIIGPSGSGKSSLARLLTGVLPPSQGEIALDQARLQQWNPDELGPCLGYLPQDIQLFSGTLAENICRFGAVDTEALLLAAQQAGVHELILSLPEGYETRLSEGGSGLSGGQRQRVALARALYRQPRLILLDEPNSSLDEAGERALMQALVNMKEAGSTLLLITHKPNLLSLTDKLLILNQGQQQAFAPTVQLLSSLQQAKTAAAVVAPSRESLS